MSPIHQSLCLKSALGLMFLLCARAAAAGLSEPPALPAADYPVVDAFSYRSRLAARAFWEPMEGTARPAVAMVGERMILKLQCNFRWSRIERASWDCAIRLDLAACRAIRFQFFCPDPSPVQRFSFYLHSGDGWYAGEFSQTRTDRWNTITIEKSDLKTEGRPAGWAHVDTLRISAWRGGDANTVMYVADLGLVGAEAEVAVIRGDSLAATKPADLGPSITYARAVAGYFRDAGVDYCVISDTDLTLARLEGRKLVVLPHNPGMPDSIADLLVKYIGSGGKLLSFYVLPAKLESIVGIRRGLYIRSENDASFATIRASNPGLPGLPQAVVQRSWNILSAEPVAGRSRAAAFWYDGEGRNTGEPAILVSDNGIHMTHVLLPDDSDKKHLMLLAMAGHFVPDLWRRSAKKSLEKTGRFGPYDGVAHVERAVIEAVGGKHEAVAMLRQAKSLKGEADRFFDDGKFGPAIAHADQANEMLVRAHCSVQEPLSGEHRAFWCHNAFGLPGLAWDEAAEILARNGFTAILPNMAWAGTAYYPSEVLPVDPEARERGDQIAECLAACRKHGLECHIWKVSWKLGQRAPAEFVNRMKRESRLQVSFDGKPMAGWLCPSHPANRKLEIDALREIAQRYDVDGVHLDYIRYPGSHSCFCDGCRTRFEQAAGVKVKEWPADVRRDRGLAGQWLEFRRNMITRVVAEVSRACREEQSGIKISAAVFGDWSTARDSVGQDWRLWCDRGYLDFVCPMDYTRGIQEFKNLVRRQAAWSGTVPCYPGIGVSVWRTPDRICTLIDQIRATREIGTGGFTVFNYGTSEARRVVPLCGLGITRMPP